MWMAWTALICSKPMTIPVEVVFKPKNDIPELNDYRKDPGASFWEKFPRNMVKQKTSLIDPRQLRNLALGAGINDDRVQLVLADLENGAKIGCHGDYRLASVSSNASSAYQYGRQVTDAVASWVKKGFVYGPVEKDDIPAAAKINGIMVRPKPDGSARVILNMSAPSGRSVNEGINAELFPAKMSSTVKWLRVLERAGKGCVIMKIDWSDAYKHIAVAAEDLELQWFMWLGKGFVELCLIFGSSSSVGIYDRAAKLVLEIVLRISGFSANLVCQHLDDVCAAASKLADLMKFEETYRAVAAQLGVQLAPTDNPEKAFKPCTEGVVLGVKYNTEEWTWSIPEDKLSRLMVQIKEVMEADHCRQDAIWSLCGRILHYMPLIPTGRFNIDHLIKANSVSKDRRYPVEISAELRRQLWFWLTMLKVCSATTAIPAPDTKWPAWTLECYTDAAGGTLDRVGSGCGAVSGSWWAYVPWSKKINCGVKAADGKKISRKLSALELVGPLICVAAGHRWSRNSHVRAWVDNFGSVKIWEKGYSTHCGLCNTLVKAISTVAAGIGCRFTIEKIRRRSNAGAVMADALSKADFSEFRKTAGESQWLLAEQPAWIPPAILYWIAKPEVDESLGARILEDISRDGGQILSIP